MKRKMCSALIILSLVALSVLGYEYFGEAETSGLVWGFSESYETLDELKAEADLVVRAHVPLYYDIREIGEAEKVTRQAFYEVVIEEVFADHTGHNVDVESEIIVNQVIGIRDAEATEFAYDKGMKPMKAGDYLLFLKKVINPADGKVYYVSNSHQHLYKWRGNEKFKNIASDELMEINYSELIGGR
ncbi:hypothetical protein [Planococcus sp. CAU13]|uniref:hypothetical protein n=1 Tax=Planococcus sp. CAU13 TaxID=1541197 RepID=UPI00052FF932|nr:hypothetical protein [Planococcus sp. CAU13]